MIEYSQRDIEQGKILKNRFTLLNLGNQCATISREEFAIDIHSWSQWSDLKKDFLELLYYYDNGGKLNEDLLLKLSDTKLVKNPIIVKRLIKLLKIV